MENSENTEKKQIPNRIPDSKGRMVFPPGVSGNPAGKPKGTKHFATMFMEVLKEEIMLKDPKSGKHVKMSMSRAMTEAMVRKAIRGDVSAFNSVADRVDGRPKQDFDIEVTQLPTPIYSGQSIKKKK